MARGQAAAGKELACGSLPGRFRDRLAAGDGGALRQRRRSREDFEAEKTHEQQFEQTREDADSQDFAVAGRCTHGYPGFDRVGADLR